MSQRFNKNTKADFNLDEYIEEKANEFPGQKSQLPTSEKQDGTFFRNIIVIAFLVVATLLYFNIGIRFRRTTVILVAVLHPPS